jgi:hypothetical protein
MGKNLNKEKEMRVPAQQSAQAEQKGRGAGPDGDAFRPVRWQGHKQATAWNSANCSSSPDIGSAGESRYGFHHFPEKQPNPDVAKVTVSSVGASCVFPKRKVLTANKK